nr:MAG TPA: Minor Head Virion Protein G6P [Inoviridae sp.]
MPVLIALLGQLLVTLIGQIIVALGVSAITYVGFDQLQQMFLNHIKSSMGGADAAAIQIFYIAGGGEALNWIFGATSFALALSSVSKLGTSFKKK